MKARNIVPARITGAAVNSLRISCLTQLERTIQEHFDEMRDLLPRPVPVRAAIGSGVEDDRYPVLRQQSAHVDHLPVEGIAFFIAVVRVRSENLAQDIRFEDRRVNLTAGELRFQRRNERGFSGSGKAGDPDGECTLRFTIHNNDSLG